MVPDIYLLTNPPPGVESAHIVRVFREYQLWVRMKGERFGSHQPYKTLGGAKSRFSRMHVKLALHPKPVWVLNTKNETDPGTHQT